MELKLQLVFITASISTFLFLMRQIHKYGLNIEDSIAWILWSFLLLIFSFFPGFSIWLSQKLGFISPSNFVLCLFIFFLYMTVFVQNIQISKLKERQKELIQKLSLKDYEERKNKSNQKN